MKARRRSLSLRRRLVLAWTVVALVLVLADVVVARQSFHVLYGRADDQVRTVAEGLAAAPTAAAVPGFVVFRIGATGW